MRFQVNRVSEWERDVSPCEGAINENNKWFVDFASLEALMAFVKKNGKCILYKDARITIYDYYVE